MKTDCESPAAWSTETAASHSTIRRMPVPQTGQTWSALHGGLTDRVSWMQLSNSRHCASLSRRLSAKKLEKLAALGIESIADIPKNFPLTDRQKRAWECAKTGKPWFGKGLKDALAGLCYPLYFMDFESLGVALPRYAGMSPYNQIPFQWSVHVQRKPGADLEHCEYLAEDGADPRLGFVKALWPAVGKNGSIVAYIADFESGCLENLAQWFPKYRDEITNIQKRLWDLLRVMRAHVYHSGFCGSFSLKSVLPALVPGMSYDGMEVAEGSDAGLA